MSASSSTTSVWRNAVWGVGWGLVLAVILAITASLVYLTASIGAPAVGLPFGQLMLVYLGGGLLGGLVVGLLRPLTRSHLGAALVGVMAAVPIGVGVRLLRYGLAPWADKDTWTLAIFALALGGVVGWRYRTIFGRPS